MKPHLRNTLVAIVIAAGMFLSFYYLERAFRHGDAKRAIQAVQSSRRSKAEPTVLESLVSQYGKEAEINWVGRLEDNFRGLVIVIATLPDQRIRQWQVDLIHGTITEQTPPG